MALNIQVLSDNRLFPQVFNIVQGTNKVDTVVYTMENYIVGEKDLSTYEWYAHLIGVEGVDAVKLTSAVVDGKLQVTFDLTEYVTQLGNTLTYQLVAKDDASSVWNSSKGVILNAESINVDDKIVADYPSILRQWELRLQEMAGSLDTAIYFIKYNETLPKEKRVAGRLYFKYLYAENKNGQLEDSNGNILIPEAVAKNIGITEIDGLTAGTVQEALQALKAYIDGKDSFPEQAGNAGKCLITDGEKPYWGKIESLPEQANNAGKFLKTNGKDAEWGELPMQGARLPLLVSIFADHLLNDAQWLRADTFSWQSGNVYVGAYEHLVDDYNNRQGRLMYRYKRSSGMIIDPLGSGSNWGGDVYCEHATPAVGDAVYVYDGRKVYTVDTIASVETTTDDLMGTDHTITLTGGAVCGWSSSNVLGMYGTEILPLEDAAGVSYYNAPDGHRICLPDQEANITAAYEATGSAWYFILDTANKQFKLPRELPREVPFNEQAPIYGNTARQGDGNGAKGAPLLASTDNVSGSKGITTGGSSGTAGAEYYVGFQQIENAYADVSTTRVASNGAQKYLYFYVGVYDEKTAQEINFGALMELINSGNSQQLTQLGVTSGTATLDANKIYSMTISGDLTFVLPESVNTSYFNQIKVMAMVTGSPVIEWGTTYFVNKEAPTIEEGHYDFYFDYDNNLGGWVLGAITKGA